MCRTLSAIAILLFLLLDHFAGQWAEAQALLMGYSGPGIGADDLAESWRKKKSGKNMDSM